MNISFIRNLATFFIVYACCNALIGKNITLSVGSENQQSIDQWGVVTQNRPDWGAAWNIGNYPESLDVIYKELGATIARFHIDYETYDNIKRREILRDAILEATSRGLKWYGLPWSPPVFMKTLDSPNGRVGKKINRLKPGYEDEVAAWLTELVSWLEKEGVPLPYGIGPQNEPDYPPPGYPGCIYTPKQMQTAIVELRKKLNEAGYQDVKVLGDDGAWPADNGYPEENTNRGTVNMLGLWPDGAFYTNKAYRDSLDIIATHTYDIHSKLYTAKPSYMKEFYDLTQATGKPVWMTEWETRHEHTFNDWEVITETMTHFNRDISSMGFNAWIGWHSWQSGLMNDGSNDSGKCVTRIRPGDVLIYKDVNFGDATKTMDLRYSSNSKKMSLSVHIDFPDGPKLADINLEQTTKKNREFVTEQIALSPTSGQYDLYIKFSSPEHWREASLNWFQLAGQDPIEAESFSDKTTTENWSSMVKPCYNSVLRRKLIYDDGETLQKRPLFYIFSKLWANAPAGKNTFVRLMSSDDTSFQAESKAADPKSYRQDMCAFISNGKMTILILNRSANDRQIDLKGLVGNSAEIFRYMKSDSESVNQDMEKVGELKIDAKSISNLTLPAESISMIITNSDSV